MKKILGKKLLGEKWEITVFLLAMIACLTPWMSAASALFLGIVMAWLKVLPLEKYSGTLIRYLLQIAVVGLGFGINLQQALNAGREGFFLTVCSIFITLSLGIFLGRKIRLSTETTLLIAAGTAICGGSAIAALAPLLAAKKEDISVSLGIIFLLNAVALIIFPWLGGDFSFESASVRSLVSHCYSGYQLCGCGSCQLWEYCFKDSHNCKIRAGSMDHPGISALSGAAKKGK